MVNLIFFIVVFLFKVDPAADQAGCMLTAALPGSAAIVVVPLSALRGVTLRGWFDDHGGGDWDSGGRHGGFVTAVAVGLGGGLLGSGRGLMVPLVL